METILRPIYQERAGHPNTLGVVIIEEGQYSVPSTDRFDAILLIIVKDAEQSVFVKHYINDDKKAAMHIVTDEQLRDWLLHGTNKQIINWIYNGKVLFDRNEYMNNLKAELIDFPFSMRKIKSGLAFARLIRSFTDGKKLYEREHYLDAYHSAIHALHHLGCMAVIEKGFLPEVTSWQQVKKIEPEIYKLYEELITSDECLSKRLELFFLAGGFLVHSKTQSGMTHFLEVLREKELWTIDEMLNHANLQNYSLNLLPMLEYLIEKGYIKVVKTETKGKNIWHRYYSLNQE